MYVVNGAKTFISNGINADVVVTVVKTDPSKAHRGISLLVVERGMPGFERGRNLDKIGMHAQDTAELFFTDVEVPVANLLGDEGKGFVYLMQNLAQERLSLAVEAVAVAQAALRWTLDYTKQRTAFGQPIAQFQNSKFVLAELHTEVQAAQVYVDRCVELHVRRRSSPPSRQRRRSSGRPSCRTRWSTAACSCTAATATCASTRSPGRGPTAACRRSTAAPARS